MNQLNTSQSIELMYGQQFIQQEEQELQEDVFQTDIHFYEYYIKSIYNDDACRCSQQLLRCAKGNRIYRIVCNLLGFYSYQTRFRRCVQILHRISYFYIWYLFSYLILMQPILQYLILLQAIICFPFLLYACFTRLIALCYFHWNDKCRLKHDFQLRRIIAVPSIYNGWSNKFYLMTIQEVHRFQYQYHLNDLRLNDLIMQSMEITGQAQNLKFMLITPELMKEIMDMLFEFKKWHSLINIYLFLTLYFETGLIFRVFNAIREII